MIKQKHWLIVCLLCLCAGVCVMTAVKRSYYRNVPNQCILFSEHRTAFSGEHNIKLLDTRSMLETDFKIKTQVYGNFFMCNFSEIAWISDNNLCIYNPFTDRLTKKNIPNLGISFEGHELKISDFSVYSVSPSGNQIAYLVPKGSRINLYDGPGEGKLIKSLGFRSELHVFDLKMNKDNLITNKAFDWGQPQWSFDSRKLLYAGPDNDDYFSQDYINNMNARDKVLIKDAIFVHDFERGVNYKLCQGVDPQWSPDGNIIAFSLGNRRIGVFNLRDKSKIDFLVSGNTDSMSFKLAWSPDQKCIAYLSAPKYALIRALVKMMSGSWYERPSSLWLINLDSTKEWYLGTKNFGDIKFAPKNYGSLENKEISGENKINVVS